MNARQSLVFMFLVWWMGSFTGVEADVAQLIGYQGRLTTIDGSPLVGEHALTFRLYDAATGGTKLWEEQHQVNLTRGDNGIFSVVLGSRAPLVAPSTFTKPLWLTTEVDGEGEMSPRLQLTAAGYALNADTLDGFNASQFLRADAATSLSEKLTLTASGLALVIQPTTDPAAETVLLEVRNAAGTRQLSVDLEGDVVLSSADFGPGASDDLRASDVSVLTGGPTSIADALHSHSAAVPPDLFDEVLPEDVGGSAVAGTLAKAAHREHVHRGIRSAAVSGQPQLFGDVVLEQGANITLTQSGQTITVAAPAVGGGDITSVIAGAGLTGGGGSGDVTLDVGAGTGIVAAADAVHVDVGTTAGKIVQLDAAGALPAVSGANLTALNASNLASGTVADARLSSSVSLLGSSIGSTELEDGAVVAAKLAADSVGASALAASAIQTGDIEVGDLPAHASTHQPGGADALPTASAVSVGTSNGAGSSTSLSRADHTHQGLHSLLVSGQPQIVGDAVLAAGSNMTLSQSGQTITISAAGAGAPGNRATTFASNAVPIGTGSDTELLSVTITKSQATSALLVLATVQLNHTGNPNNKAVDVKLFRDATQLDASYQARIGTANRAVSELPVAVHGWDASGAGTYTFSLRVRSDGTGAEATVRRLTVIELL